MDTLTKGCKRLARFTGTHATCPACGHEAQIALPAHGLAADAGLRGLVEFVEAATKHADINVRLGAAMTLRQFAEGTDGR